MKESFLDRQKYTLLFLGFQCSSARLSSGKLLIYYNELKCEKNKYLVNCLINLSVTISEIKLTNSSLKLISTWQCADFILFKPH